MSNHAVGGFGPLLRQWREQRRLTQLDLALEAESSARHVSFLETGRTVPSKDMVALLCRVLDIPLRERNLMFLAAGHAPPYRETPLDDARMAQVREALVLILERHEPYSAFACDHRWNLVMANAAYVEFLCYTVGARASTLEPYVVLPKPHLNVLHLVFDPDGVRPYLVNWAEIAKALLDQVHRAALWRADPALRALRDELLTYPDVPASWHEPDLDAPPALMLPCELRGLGAAKNARMFSTVTTLSTPQDITLEDLHVEAFYPADAETAALTFYQAPRGD